MPENFDVKLNVPRENDKVYKDNRIKRYEQQRGRGRPNEPINLQTVIRDIKMRMLAPDLEQELIKRASKYPHGALPMFNATMPQMIINAQRSKKTDT